MTIGIMHHAKQLAVIFFCDVMGRFGRINAGMIKETAAHRMDSLFFVM